MSVYCECCVVRCGSLRRADHSSRGVLPTVVCLNECEHETSITRRFWPTVVEGRRIQNNAMITCSAQNAYNCL
jgi:hypothetical protein